MTTNAGVERVHFDHFRFQAYDMLPDQFEACCRCHRPVHHGCLGEVEYQVRGSPGSILDVRAWCASLRD
jgi:hypothetical protein